MTLPPPLNRLRERAANHAAPLLLFGLLVIGAVLTYLQYATIFPDAAATVLDLPGRFWLTVTLLYAVSMVAENFWTGIPHYTGWKKVLALLDLMLLGILVFVTGGASSALTPLYYLQVVLMACFGETRLGTLDEQIVARRGASRATAILPLYYVWYLPALAAAFFVPLGASDEPRVLLQFGGLVGVGLVTRSIARIWRERTAAEVVRAADAEERMRLAQYQAQLARCQAEMAHEGNRQREVLNWINLTAGLTHSIGNEVLAFHHYSQEILDYLDKAENVPEQIEESMEFIYDTNRARLGFINFLQEFAEMMKISAADVRQVPAGLTQIDLHKLIHTVREKVGRFESRELDQNESDPQIQRQLKKNLELGLIIHFESERARHVASGRKPVLDFIFYEFIKNGLRNCSGQRRLKVIVSRREEQVLFRFINDLDVETKDPVSGRSLSCSLCHKHVPALFWLKNSDFLDAFCEPCLKRKVEENLEQCWTPGKTSQGGKGLGLFVIRHFLDQYYFGTTAAGIFSWDTREVYFEVSIPNRLDQRIDAYNGMQEERRKMRVAP